MKRTPPRRYRRFAGIGNDRVVHSAASLALNFPASLERFERAYVHFLKSQNLRWLLLDVLLPLAVAGMALWYLRR